jgi:hypothetical protein
MVGDGSRLLLVSLRWFLFGKRNLRELPSPPLLSSSCPCPSGKVLSSRVLFGGNFGELPIPRVVVVIGIPLLSWRRGTTDWRENQAIPRGRSREAAPRLPIDRSFVLFRGALAGLFGSSGWLLDWWRMSRGRRGLWHFALSRHRHPCRRWLTNFLLDFLRRRDSTHLLSLQNRVREGVQTIAL